MKVLVTCPPMLGLIEEFRFIFESKKVDIVTPKVTQTLTEDELIDLLPHVDGWIIGDDPATRRVFEAGKAGKLKAAVKWGVGVDNVDFEACKDLSIPIINTPQMFGSEVADVGISFLIGLARQTYYIDRKVRHGAWPKPPGISIAGKSVGLVGFGDIGKSSASRLTALQLNVTVYDPYAGITDEDKSRYIFDQWPNNIENHDFIFLTCALNSSTKYIINNESLSLMKKGVRIINVSRGALINEEDLLVALESGQVHSVALDVFEKEPLPSTSELRNYEFNIFGTHNGSNTRDAVQRASLQAIDSLFGFLKI